MQSKVSKLMPHHFYIFHYTKLFSPNLNKISSTPLKPDLLAIPGRATSLAVVGLGSASWSRVRPPSEEKQNHQDVRYFHNNILQHLLHKPDKSCKTGFKISAVQDTTHSFHNYSQGFLVQIGISQGTITPKGKIQLELTVTFPRLTQSNLVG